MLKIRYLASLMHFPIRVWHVHPHDRLRGIQPPMRDIRINSHVVPVSQIQSIAVYTPPNPDYHQDSKVRTSPPVEDFLSFFLK